MSNRTFTTRRSFRPACNSLKQKVQQSVNGTGKNFMKNGRGDWIRTSDLYVPNVALQPD